MEADRPDLGRIGTSREMTVTPLLKGSRSSEAVEYEPIGDNNKEDKRDEEEPSVSSSSVSLVISTLNPGPVKKVFLLS